MSEEEINKTPCLCISCGWQGHLEETEIDMEELEPVCPKCLSDRIVLSDSEDFLFNNEEE